MKRVIRELLEAAQATQPPAGSRLALATEAMAKEFRDSMDKKKAGAKLRRINKRYNTGHLTKPARKPLHLQRHGMKTATPLHPAAHISTVLYASE